MSSLSPVLPSGTSSSSSSSSTSSSSSSSSSSSLSPALREQETKTLSEQSAKTDNTARDQISAFVAENFQTLLGSGDHIADCDYVLLCDIHGNIPLSVRNGELVDLLPKIKNLGVERLNTDKTMTPKEYEPSHFVESDKTIIHWDTRDLSNQQKMQLFYTSSMETYRFILSLKKGSPSESEKETFKKFMTALNTQLSNNHNFSEFGFLKTLSLVLNTDTINKLGASEFLLQETLFRTLETFQDIGSNEFSNRQNSLIDTLSKTAGAYICGKNHLSVARVEQPIMKEAEAEVKNNEEEYRKKEKEIMDIHFKNFESSLGLLYKSLRGKKFIVLSASTDPLSTKLQEKLNRVGTFSQFVQSNPKVGKELTLTDMYKRMQMLMGYVQKPEVQKNIQDFNATL